MGREVAAVVSEPQGPMTGGPLEFRTVQGSCRLQMVDLIKRPQPVSFGCWDFRVPDFLREEPTCTTSVNNIQI